MGLSTKGNPPQKIVPIASSKIELMRAAAEKQLSPEEYEEFLYLASQLRLHGLTPLINAQLGKLMAKIRWELEVEESPEWTAALIACDEAFLGNELKAMCFEEGLSFAHKKEMRRKLYKKDRTEVVEIMEPYLKGERVSRKAVEKYLELRGEE